MIIMKAKVYDISGKEAGNVDLPSFFEGDVRQDVIKRTVLAQQSARRQKYGTDPLAGKKTSAHYHGSRHYRFTMMNREMSRIPRIHGKVGYMVWRARFAPHAVKGRRAHPPLAAKNWLQKVNKKERELAVMSALAASANNEFARTMPIVFTDDFENMHKTKDVVALLGKIAAPELERCMQKNVRAGRGKRRGRKYQKKKGLLIITSKNCSALRASRAIAGIDAVSVKNINAELLAPGAQPGRPIILTKSSISELQKRFGE